MILEDFNIQTYDFNNKISTNITNQSEKLKDWPALYIIHDDKKAYIGETTNAIKRVEQHLKSEEKKKLKKIEIFSSNQFNKSATLDIEHFLIEHMLADGKFKLLNLNKGIQNHHYYQSEEYEKDFKHIWKKLKNEGLVYEENYKYLENEDIFKYSPYKELSREQYEVTDEILTELLEDMYNKQESTFYIKGGPGTGKSILAIYLMKRLNDMQRELIVQEDDYISYHSVKLKEILDNNKKEKLKIGFVVPMQSFRKTIQQVFKRVNGLQVNMVISPFAVMKAEEQYDILIVDESHRLSKRNSTRSKEHKRYYEEDGTQLDWIKKKSKYQIFFYDKGQKIRSADVGEDIVNGIDSNKKNYQYELTSQFRCLAGEDYIRYIRDIFSSYPPEKMINFNSDKYEFYLFNNVNDMVEAIKAKARDKRYKLSRNLAGDAWQWHKGENDIKIGPYSYPWNTTNIDFINSKNAIN